MTVITVPGVFFSLSSAGMSLSSSVKSMAGFTALGLAIASVMRRPRQNSTNQLIMRARVIILRLLEDCGSDIPPPASALYTHPHESGFLDNGPNKWSVYYTK